MVELQQCGDIGVEATQSAFMPFPWTQSVMIKESKKAAERKSESDVSKRLRLNLNKVDEVTIGNHTVPTIIP
ncbi:hypothetical protein KIN20_019310 [Parelaphostrongylus tenuis]|uniref:Uncharacterized protein n=1 Tax=Parelaphostrongylus tenuis TaxID=148309 RepID=A0AAD5QSA2_PARTN|nr:hypothetical protein KIN20_019310 [Parelaphostrongylus tenuis]